jgi:hypothetical protein
LCYKWPVIGDSFADFFYVTWNFSLAVLDDYIILAALHPSSPEAFWAQPFLIFLITLMLACLGPKHFAACGTVSPIWLIFSSCSSPLWLVVVQAALGWQDLNPPVLLWLKFRV